MAFKVCTRLAIMVSILLLTACMTVGQYFPTNNVNRIEIGKTTRAEVLELFGTPWRTGLEDGRTAWTYAHYKYSAGNQTLARDLVVRFNDQGIVTSYSFSSSVPGEGEGR